MSARRSRALGLALALACKPEPATPEPPPPSATGAPFATLALAGGPRCTVSRPSELGATLTLRGEPSDVRVAASRGGGLVAWMQPHPTKLVGRLVAVRALDVDGRPIGAVQTVQPPVAAVLQDVVADERGFYVLVQAPDQPRANHVLALRADGSALGEFVEVPDTGGLHPVARGPARPDGVAVVFGPQLGGRDSVWALLDRDDRGVRLQAVKSVPRWQGLAGDDARAWITGEGRPALLVARGGAPLEQVVDGDVLLAGAGLPGDPALGLDARWRGDAVDLVWAAPAAGGPTIRRALLREGGALELDPPGLAEFDHHVELALSDPLQALRRTRAGRSLAGDALDLAAVDRERVGDLHSVAWAWTGAAFVVGYPARVEAGVTARTLRVTCPPT